MSILNEKTLLPISFVIVIMGGVAWLTNLNASVMTLQETADQRGVALQRMADDIARIREDIGEIKGYVKKHP